MITATKEELRQLLLSQLQSELADLEKSFAHAKETSIVSDGRMVSRYDTMGVEAAWKADSLQTNIDEKRRAIAQIESLDLSNKQAKVVLGSLVGLGQMENGTRELYFIVPAAGGMILTATASGFPITTVTVMAPLAQALIGRRVGDTVETPTEVAVVTLIV